jgi:16S rRNA (uracil1498-N3)-methyltransferase
VSASADGPEWAAGADAVAHVFVDALDDVCDIAGGDGHHLQRVRRLTRGERITAADGAGRWRLYEIVDIKRGRLVLVAMATARDEPMLEPRVALAVALTKAGIDTIAARTTELGVSRIIPVQTERSIVRWDASKGIAAVNRLRTVVREAAAQSRRARLPVVEPPITLADLADRADVVVADRSGRPAAELPEPATGEWTVVVGPEGGLSPSELELLGGAPRLGLGPHVLRAETAPIAAAAVLVARGLS